MMRSLWNAGISTRMCFLALALVLLSGCGLKRSYEVKGRIVGFGDDGRTVIVEHEDIPDLMPAMTMPFKTTEGNALKDLEYGDAIRFTLFLSTDSSWITSIAPLPDDAVARHPAGAPAPPPGTSPETPILQAGDAVPTFELVSQDGSPVRLDDYREKALLVTFIYTRCPLPDFCPLMSQRFRNLQPELQEQYGDRVELLSISFDPTYDTPEVLRDYARRYTSNTERWTFATGSAEQVGRVSHMFGVFYQDAKNEQELLHNLTTALITPEGRVDTIWRGNEWTEQDVLSALEEVMREQPGA